MNKLGIAFGAGGAKGIAHLGIWQALNENGIRAQVVTGCSAGSVIAACYALGKTPEWVMEQALSLKQSDFTDLSLNPLKSKSIFKGEKMKAIFNRYFGEYKIEDLKTPFSVVATDLITGKLHEFTGGSLTTAVLASCSIPIVYPPVEVGDMTLVDGGTLVRTPVKSAKKLGAEKVIAIDVNSTIADEFAVKGALSVAFRCVDIMDHRDETSADARPDVIIRPELGDIDQYKVDRLREIFDRGYTAAKAAIPQIKELIA